MSSFDPNHSLPTAPAVTPPAPISLAGMTLKQVEALAIEQTLKACKGNKAKSARMLGISEKSIYNKMKRLGIRLETINQRHHEDAPDTNQSRS